MSDVVDRLLSWHDDYVVTETRCTGDEVQALMSEAADEIERLRERLANLAEAGTGYSQQTVDAITKEREALRAGKAGAVHLLRWLIDIEGPQLGSIVWAKCVADFLAQEDKS